MESGYKGFLAFLSSHASNSRFSDFLPDSPFRDWLWQRDPYILEPNVSTESQVANFCTFGQSWKNTHWPYFGTIRAGLGSLKSKFVSHQDAMRTP